MTCQLRIQIVINMINKKYIITALLVLFVFMLLIINQKILIQRLVFFKCTVKWRKLIKNDYSNDNKTQHKKV